MRLSAPGYESLPHQVDTQNCFCPGLSVRACASAYVGAQQVELTTQIETVFWSDEGARARDRITRCVIGTNTWLIEPESDSYQKQTWLFNGTNLISQTLVIGYPSKHPELYERNHPGHEASIGQRFTNIVAFRDRNPFRPVRAADIPWSLDTKISWLAFCSGSLLNREGRLLFPPSEFWKQRMDTASGFTDRTVVFQDDLGLPKRMELYTTSGQLAFEYSVLSSTNLLGWNVPLEFYLNQYGWPGSKEWRVYYTAKGKVTAISSPARSELPTDNERPTEE